MEKLLSILACPSCKALVEMDGKRQEILCLSCQKRYGLVRNTPVMLDEESKGEINTYMASSGGEEMLSQYHRKDIFTRLYQTGLKFFGGSTFRLPVVKKRLKQLLNLGGKEGLILEIGSGTRRLHEKVINLDISPFQNVDVVGEASKLPFKEDSFEAVILMSVLEHTRQAKKVVEESFRVLKKGGFIYAEIPFIFRYHPYPTDFWRFTSQGFEELFSQFKKEEIGACVGPGSGLLGLITHYVSLFSFSNNKVINSFLKAITFAFLFPLKYTDLLLVRNKRSLEMAGILYYLGKKVDKRYVPERINN